jgi:BolA family transcriptional regulator, general stress-responsive regulator
MSMQENIKQKLSNTFQPTHLEVVDESHQHNVPAGAESHFKVTVVSNQFTDQKLIQCHRMINECLTDELQGQIHALAIHTYAPDAWNAQVGSPDSPPCMGGGK